MQMQYGRFSFKTEKIIRIVKKLSKVWRPYGNNRKTNELTLIVAKISNSKRINENMLVIVSFFAGQIVGFIVFRND